MAKKIIAFSIEIDGKKDVLELAQVFNLLAQQVQNVNKELDELNKKTGKVSGDGIKKTETALKNTGTSAQRLATNLKESFNEFDKGNKAARDLGNGYFEIQKAINKTSEEAKQNSTSISDLIAKNKELKKALQEADQAAESINFKGQTKSVKDLTKEFADNNDKIKAFRKELRTGKKETDIQKGSILDLRKRVAELKKEYIALTPAQQKFSLQGRKTRKELISLTKELKRQEEQIGDFRRSVGNYEKALGRVGRAALKVFGIRGAFEGLRRIGQGLTELVKNGAATNKTFEGIQNAAGGLTNSLTSAGEGILNTFGGTIQKVIENFSFVIFKVSEAFQNVAASGGILGTIFGGIGAFFRDFPAIIGGAANVFSNFIEIASNGLTDVALKAERTFLNIKASILELTGADVSEVTARLNEINNTLEDNAANALTFSRAFKEGFENVKKEQEEFLKLNEEDAQQRAAALEQAEKAEEQRKAAAEARKQAEEEEKQRLEELNQARRDFLQSRVDEQNAITKIIKDLGRELIDAEIKNEEDRTAAAIRAENERFDRLREARNANFQQVLDEATQQEAQAQALFGFGSEEALRVEQENAEALRELQAINNNLAEQQEKEHQTNLQTIRDEAAKKELEQQKASFDALDAEIAAELAELEAQEAAAAERSDEIIKKQLESAEATKDAVFTAVNAVLDGISQIAQLAADEENARFEAAISERQNVIDNLNEELANATGLQKKFLQQRIEQETAAQQEIEKRAEKARKDQAEAQKAIAIVQAVINTALAITQALSSSPPPASFILAGVAAALGAVQIASIASQKFAAGGVLAEDGGIIQGPSHEAGGVPFTIGGRPGFEAEGGEAIINKKSTALYKPLLSRINQLGGGVAFANGGVLSAPLTPSLATNQQAQNNFENLTEAYNNQTAAINNRIDRIQVTNSVESFNEVADNEEELNTETTI